LIARQSNRAGYIKPVYQMIEMMDDRSSLECGSDLRSMAYCRHVINYKIHFTDVASTVHRHRFIFPTFISEQTDLSHETKRFALINWTTGSSTVAGKPPDVYYYSEMFYS